MRLASLLLAAVAVGCSIDHFEDDGPVSQQQAALVDPAACPGTHWIGPTSTGACGTYKGPNGKFVGSKLFGASAVPGLASTCAYDWSPTIAGTLPDAFDLSVVPTNADRDCHVVGASGSPVGSSPTVLSPLHDSFLLSAGAATLPRVGSGMMPPSVRVAVLDSSPTKIDSGRAVVGKYEHGFDVGRVVRELTCPSDDPTRPPCIGQIASTLTLPLTAPNVTDVTNGGYFGSQGDLARAIAQSVDGWVARRSSTATEPMRLVINLSVGWDSDRGYETVPVHGGYSYPARAVVDALRHAACRGALVIAAAGNRSGGATESKGAMFPAAWESMPAPGSAECLPFEGVATEDARLHVFPPARTYAPLVYAVGGVDAADRPLTLTRPLGTPRLVAHGSEVVTRSASSGFSNNLTGTSMSTAVVTAAATAAWAYAPTLAPAQLMSLVRSGAVDLSLNAPADVKKTSADFCLGQVCGPITRVSVAGAVAAACGTSASACELGAIDALKAKTVARYAGTRPSWPGGWSSIDPKLDVSKPVGACVGPSCGVASDLVTQVTQPWVGPQPGKGGCDVCGLNSFGTFYLVLTDPWWTMGPGPAYLGVDTSAGSYAYTMTPTQQATSYSLEGIDPATKVYGATLSFAPPSQPGYASMEQVTVW